MRLFYLDPALAGNQGHHATVCQSIVAQAKARGIETLVFGYQTMPKEWIEKKVAAAFFRAWPYTLTDGDPYCGFMNAFFDAAGTLFEDLNRLPPMTRSDVIYLPVAQAGQILGLGQWLSGFAPGTAPAAIADLVALPGLEGVQENGKHVWQTRDPRIDPRATIYRYAGLHLATFELPTLQVVTTVGAWVDAYNELLQRKVHHLSTLPFEGPKTLFKRGTGEQLTIVALGYQWEQKGFHLLPEIFAGLLAAHRHIKIIAHNSNPNLEKMPETRHALRELAGSDQRLVYKESIMREGTYQTFLDNADMLLCPYNPEFYRTTPSAVVTEAIANGIPVIIPAGTALAADAEAFGVGVTFDSFDAPAATGAAICMLDDFDAHAAKSLAAAERWNKEKGVARFVDEILQIARAGIL